MVTVAFFLSYIMLSSFILVNIFVAIIVDSVSAHYKVTSSTAITFRCDALLIQVCFHLLINVRLTITPSPGD